MRRAVLLVALVGCGDNSAGGRCEVRTERQALTAEERKVVGEASPYPADAMLRARDAELAGSQRARRAAAWAAIERAVEPVPLAVDVQPGGPDALPRWHTWYARDDLHRVFQKVWRGLPGVLRHARAAIPDDALDAAFVWNPSAVDDDPAWSQQRWEDYVASLDDQLAVDGVGDIARVGYSPSAGRTLLAGYAEQMSCLDHGAPPAFVDGPPAPPVSLRVPLSLGACEDQSFGPYFIASGEQLAVRAEAALQVRRDTIDGPIACTADAARSCVVDGPGAVWVIASSDDAPMTGTLVVDTVAPDAPWAGCLATRFPGDAALVKADWRRADLEFTVPVHATSADALAAALAAGSWGDGETTADPGPDAIYTVRAENGSTFRLTGLHLMTRELDHWLWVTLWWSPEPSTDFGADRPASLTGVWSHYKMCASTAFEENDPDPAGGFAGDHPDLARALATVSTPGGASWCSNPYFETGPGEAATNCLGCHQHGGTHLDPAAIVGDPQRFPHHGRTLVRDNFPVDYSWQSDRGDQLANMIQDEVLYWDPVP